MLIIHSQSHRLHNPQFEFFEGEVIPHPEKTERPEAILNALKLTNWTIQPITQKISKKLLYQVHDREYIQFLKYFCRIMNNDSCRYPSVFPKQINPSLDNLQAKLGFYSLDTYTPILKNTYTAALESASAAYEAGRIIHQGMEKNVYALCRPPGHHAEKSQMGGYCYINNAAIAAHYLSEFGRVAILDLDFHHGNGTQSIFYDRNDVLYASIHADPNQKFPFLSGFRDEIGRGKGTGFNLNRPLPLGTAFNEYQIVLKELLGKLEIFNPEYLVISLGTDTHLLDPICGFRLIEENFSQMGRLIGAVNKKTVIIQEGGYNLDVIGVCVSNFLQELKNNQAT